MTFARVLVFATIAITIAVFSTSVYRSAKRTNGYCFETGQRLSDAGSLALARRYAIQGNPLRKDPVYKNADLTIRLIATSELRDEKQVPAWVRRSGGFRAYALVQYDPEGLDAHDLQLLKSGELLIVANCGAIRTNMREFKWKLL
ncbi:hypothetical protein [Ruegeria sp.]|uniref:hypothetical protein n=1 Tax=Ruegeria sp. TaxID=1879320 RepID=UPI003B0084C2